MYKITTVLLFLYLTMLPFSSIAKSGIIWHWEDRFSQSEREKLRKWIELTVEGVEKRVTPYPFNLHIFFHRLDRANEPVPWAHTERSSRQGVHFHVNAGYSLKDFLADWTAPHELSHLLIPHLGRDHAWFAEGFASYMQYQIMQAMGILTHKQVQERYRRNIRKADNSYNLKKLPFLDAVSWLYTKREYPTVYWGGAVYFLQVDQTLRSQDSSLIQVLAKFVECCRYKRPDLNSLINELDRLSSSSAFSDQLNVMKNKAGFPDNADLF